MARRRTPSREERALWRAATRGVAPLRPSLLSDPEPPPEGAPAPPAPSKIAPRPALRRAPPRRLRPMAPESPAGVDRRTSENLRRGKLAIEARLDLHGLTEAEAHMAVIGFVTRARASGRRVVLVITGKGRGQGGRSVLRAKLPDWLNDQPLREQLLHYSPAQPRDGGGGAFYLLLRRG